MVSTNWDYMIKFFVLTSFIVATVMSVNYGYELLTAELGRSVSQSYGAIGAQMEQNTSCFNRTDCPSKQIGQDMADINGQFQNVLRASALN